MSRVLKVNDGDYRIVVTSPTPTQSTPTITLDTGNQVGEVIVTGDLTVLGNTTVIESETVNIKDNIIYLNSGESGAGVTLQTSGIQIDRGTQPDGQILFTENVSFYSPTTAGFNAGTFVFKDQSNLLRGIRTNSISTGGGDLALINEGSGLVTVTGTTDYHLNVQASSDPDVLVTRQWVEQYVQSEGFEAGQGQAVTDKISRLDTSVQVFDAAVSGGVSNVKIKFDNVVKAVLTSSTFSINADLDINGKTLISNNVISAQTAGDNLKLVPAVGRNIEIDSPVQLNNQTDPSAGAGHTKFYAKSAIGTGKTGLYFVNTTTSDELIAKNRSLLWSMLF